MARGKHLSIEEARKLRKLDQFVKVHPSKAKKALFDKLFNSVAMEGKDDRETYQFGRSRKPRD